MTGNDEVANATGPLRLVCASANPHKVAEIAAILDGLVQLLPRPSEVGEVVEDAGTLEGNARLKATAICAATGHAALADDTGLFVDALDGAPGVDTAYFAGPGATDAENRAELLRRMEGVHDRRATFVTVAMIVRPDGSELAVRGECRGIIAPDERGGGGFGYDPLFIPDEGDGGTFAQLGEAVKNQVSHRSRALAALLSALAS